METESVEKYWSRFTDSYDNNQEFVVGKDLLDEIKIELNGLPELGKMAELGCGTGYFTESIIRKSNRMIATDLSIEMLEIAKKRFNQYSHISFQKENCMNLSFISNDFDAVFMANLIHVIKDPHKVFQECHRILKKNGILIIVTFTSHGMNIWETIKLGIRFVRSWGKPPRHTHSFSTKGVVSLMEDAGFTIERSKLIGHRTKALYIIGKKR